MSPVDDLRVKRQRHATSFTLSEHTRPKKRKLPSRPQSPAEEEEGRGGLAADARSLVAKRQRCMVLEHGIERLSLTPPSHPAQDEAAMLVVPAPAPELATHLPLAPVPTDFAPSSPQWLDVPLGPAFQHSSSSPTTTLDPQPVLPTAAIEDFKMRSWYEPEKDRIVVTDLDASSDDEEGDAGAVDDAPKLPRTVLQALLRGSADPVAHGDVPRMLLAGLLPPPFAPLPPSLPPLEPASFCPGPGSSVEAMDVEQ